MASQYRAAAATSATIRPAIAVPLWSPAPSFFEVVETGAAPVDDAFVVGAVVLP